MANREIEFTSDNAGPFYAYPASEPDFTDWLTERLACAEVADRWTVTLDDADDYYIFAGASAPTSWHDNEVYVDFSDRRQLTSIMANVSGGVVAATSPVTSTGTLSNPIVIGDDYLDANDRAFIWYITPLEATFATCTTKFGGVDEQGNEWLVTGTMAEVEVDGDDKWSLSFDLPEAVTELLEVGKAKWSVAVYTATSDQITVARGSVQVVLAFTE